MNRARGIVASGRFRCIIALLLVALAALLAARGVGAGRSDAGAGVLRGGQRVLLGAVSGRGAGVSADDAVGGAGESVAVDRYDLLQRDARRGALSPGAECRGAASFDQACLMLLVVSGLHAAGDVRGSAAGGESAAGAGAVGAGRAAVDAGQLSADDADRGGESHRCAAGDAAGRDVFAGAVLAVERGRGDADGGAGDAAAERVVGAAREARSDFEGAGDDDGAAESDGGEPLVAGVDGAAGGDREGGGRRRGRGEDAARAGGDRRRNV